MPRVVAYGKEKGVGIWVYVNQHALMKQARELFPILRQWGIVGVKSGFVQYASHRWATWLHDLVRLAAENHLMMNIHDEFRPSGFSRTYPNLLTQEGICGNEEFPDATHNTILPFTRMIMVRQTIPSAISTNGLRLPMPTSWLPRLFSIALCRLFSGMTNLLFITANRKWNGSRICKRCLMIQKC